jgi:hypothetical protein
MSREKKDQEPFLYLHDEHTRRISQTTALPSGYAPRLANLKARVRAAQVRAILSVSRGNENGAG